MHKTIFNIAKIVMQWIIYDFALPLAHEKQYILRGKKKKERNEKNIVETKLWEME